VVAKRGARKNGKRNKRGSENLVPALLITISGLWLLWLAIWVACLALLGYLWLHYMSTAPAGMLGDFAKGGLLGVMVGNAKRMMPFVVLAVAGSVSFILLAISVIVLVAA